MTSDKTKIALLIEKVENLEECTKLLVTKIEFLARVSPLEKVVYGMVTMGLIAIAGALISLVIKQ